MNRALTDETRETSSNSLPYAWPADTTPVTPLPRGPRIPPGGCGNSSIEGRVRFSTPLRPGSVQAGHRAGPEFLRYCIFASDRALLIARHGVVHPDHPSRHVEPPVAEYHNTLDDVGDGLRVWVIRIIGGANFGREAGRAHQEPNDVSAQQLIVELSVQTLAGSDPPIVLVLITSWRRSPAKCFSSSFRSASSACAHGKRT